MAEERKPYTPTDGAEDIERLAQEGQEALTRQLEEAADFSFLDEAADLSALDELADFSALDEALNEVDLLDLPALDEIADLTALDKTLEEASPLLAEELESTDFGL